MIFSNGVCSQGLAKRVQAKMLLASTAEIYGGLSYALFRVITHLENLEKSGNSNVVRENSRKMKVMGNWIQRLIKL